MAARRIAGYMMLAALICVLAMILLDGIPVEEIGPEWIIGKPPRQELPAGMQRRELWAGEDEIELPDGRRMRVIKGSE